MSDEKGHSNTENSNIDASSPYPNQGHVTDWNQSHENKRDTRWL